MAGLWLFVLLFKAAIPRGETELEARQLIEDAIRLHIESRLAHNEPIYREVDSRKVRVAV